MLLLSVAWAAEPAENPLLEPMHERYALLDATRQAVIDGKLAQAKAAAKKLARARGAGLPIEWGPLADAVSARANEVRRAPDLVAAAGATAHIAPACAACHVATRGGPNADELAALPPQDWPAGANMALHAWATDVMWLGLLGQNDAAWNRGAQELAAEPIPLKFPEPPIQEGRTQLELRLYVLAGKAGTLETPDERATLYGEMLATCAECHIGPAHRD